MKKLSWFFLFAFMAYACQLENADEIKVTQLDDASGATVEPVLIDPWQSGDAAYEVGQAGCGSDFAYKIDNNTAGNPTVNTSVGNTITITNSNGYCFDWASEWPVTCVIVKAGTGALIYYYPGGAYSDTNLCAPEAKEISHVSFGYNNPDNCFEDETAWAEGARYVKKGNWAMYVDYYGVEKTVELIADFTNYVHAGTVTFSAPVDGKVTITVNLTGGAIFYYDLNDPLYDNNLKVMDYAKAPTKTPSPGLFLWKTNIETGSTTGSIVVPVNNFYGVHTDIALLVPCE